MIADLKPYPAYQDSGVGRRRMYQTPSGNPERQRGPTHYLSAYLLSYEG